MAHFRGCYTGHLDFGRTLVYSSQPWCPSSIAPPSECFICKVSRNKRKKVSQMQLQFGRGLLNTLPDFSSSFHLLKPLSSTVHHIPGISVLLIRAVMIHSGIMQNDTLDKWTGLEVEGKDLEISFSALIPPPLRFSATWTQGCGHDPMKSFAGYLCFSMVFETFSKDSRKLPWDRVV